MTITVPLPALHDLLVFAGGMASGVVCFLVLLGMWWER
jgi:hypothetical protein